MRPRKYTIIRDILTLLLLAVVVFVPSIASAHQPRLVEGRQTLVLSPEISKVYYGTLMGEPDVYTIQVTAPFDLYVGVLVPDIAGQKKDVSAAILKDYGRQIAVLDGATTSWKQFFEPFGHDTYWQGPEYKARVQAGTYEVRVWSSNNDSKYSLAIGEIEAFNLKETVNALTLIPQLKKNFFDGSPVDFILSPFGWGLIVLMYIIAGIVGLIYRTVMKRLARTSPRKASKNIGRNDRLIRAVIGVVLLLWAITTTWNPILIFFSGFALFEAVFSWCGVYAAMGRNTCEVGE